MGKSIYKNLSPKNKSWIKTKALETLLKNKLIDLNLNSYPIRTRSKVIKSAICKTMGYEVPLSFKKTKPRFPCQNLDVYTQKSNNLQIWNEELDSDRRYALIRLNNKNTVQNIKVVTGNDLIPLDKTGKLTKKYQATYKSKDEEDSKLLSSDSSKVKDWLYPQSLKLNFTKIKPTDKPQKGMLMPITYLFEKLNSLIGTSIPFIGGDQERNRGAELHKLVCKSLGYSSYKDSGQFPDLPHQLLEVKLQTSPTIDLGLILPTSKMKIKNSRQFRHCDVRYAIFYGNIKGSKVYLTQVLICSGEQFFDHFSQFEGKLLNTKIQISLPEDFFD